MAIFRLPCLAAALVCCLAAARASRAATSFFLSNAAAGLGKIQLEDSTARPVGVDANPAGRESYSIVSLTWVLAYREGNGGKLSALKELFTWMVSDEAQSMAPDHGYVSLPTLTLDRARQAIELLQE